MNDTDKKIAEIKTTIANASKQLAELEQAREREKAAPGVWVPKDFKRYFYVSATGRVIKDTNTQDLDDEDRFQIGNVFPTQETAERHVKRLKVTQRLKELAGGFVPDWEDSSLEYFPIYNHRTNKIEVSWSIRDQCWPHSHFKSQDAMQHAIDTLGDDLRVLFDVGV